jgi:hypothetical protein
VLFQGDPLSSRLVGKVARYGKMVARAGEPDTIWVTELWRSQSDLDAAIEKIRGSERVAAVMALVEDAQMIELDLLGGKGPS